MLSLPYEIKRLDRWLNWCYRTRDGKLTKLPVSPWTGVLADVTKPGGCCTNYYHAINYVLKTGMGLGFVFAGDGIVGIDLDKCCTGGKISDEAAQWIGRFGSYAEWSPSHTGIKIFVFAKIPDGVDGRRRGRREVYSRNRFFTITGMRVHEAPLEVREAQEALDLFWSESFPENKKEPIARAPSACLGDEATIAMVSSHHVGAHLWIGNWKIAGLASHSEADLVLCNLLARFCGGNPQDVDRLFRTSALYRRKWDRKDYRERTLALACSM
ncbi:MAG: hypothetical protein ACREBU_17420 [Nitrososphaera sp.]